MSDFPGFSIDAGFATILIAFVPAIIGYVGFNLRIRHRRKRLASALLVEVSQKLERIVRSPQWLDRAEELVEADKSPNMIVEAQQDTIFDTHQNILLDLPVVVLKRVVRFYKIDDFLNLAFSEFSSTEFKNVERPRQLQHIKNIREEIVPEAIKSALQAELALTLESELKCLGEKSFRQRHHSRYTIHTGTLQKAVKTYRDRLSKMKNMAAK